MAINVTHPAQAASAYAQAANRAIDDGVSAAASDTVAGGPSFANLVQDQIGDAIKAGHASEAASLGAIDGSADVVDLVTAVNNAEMTLQTVVAVRDRVVQAYQDTN